MYETIKGFVSAKPIDKFLEDKSSFLTYHLFKRH
jgi:hypothetical protein